MAERTRNARLSIRCAERHPAVLFAARELRRYLRRLDGAAGGEVRLGTLAALGLAPAGALPAHPFDDRIVVRAGGGRAVLAGANARSILFAAYRWLEELGCRWLRPGPGGERVPRRAAPLSVSVSLDERPAQRHRCLCIEGSCSRRHVLDMVDYAAKRGFNAYFLQFRTSYTFFNRWYGSESRRGRPPRAIPVESTAAHAEAVAAAAVRRGLILHRVGHGWTCEPFGVPGLEWRAYHGPVPAAARRLFAQVRGRRALWDGIPLNTQLCYSQARARAIMARAVVGYAVAHPEAEVLHVWLADGANNFCECPGCRRHRPSELYLALLNEIDRRLTARHLPTRIVFLAYVNLLWAPRRGQIRNPDRFILMFAPITRSYSWPFLGAKQAPAEAPGPHRHNRTEFPRSPQANLALFAGWRRAFRGDCVDFDYHLWTDWVHDPGQMQCARVLHTDARRLDRLGMQGFISCQAQRVAFPTGLPLHLLGKALWDPRPGFARLTREYLHDCFGSEGAAVRRYLETLSRLFDPARLRQGVAADQGTLERLARVPATATAAGALIARLCRHPDPAVAAGGALLEHHAWYVSELARLLRHVALGKASAAAATQARLEAGLASRLPAIGAACDTFTVMNVLRRWRAAAQAQGVLPAGPA